jgi:hypothetical protein
LKIVGSGFGPLIYGLEDCSFDAFRLKCKEVWKAVGLVPELPQYLVCVSLAWVNLFIPMYMIL